MYEMIIEYDRDNATQRWVKVAPKDSNGYLQFGVFESFGRFIDVRQSNVPEDAYRDNIAYIFGGYADYVYRWYQSFGSNQIRHLNTLYKWAKHFGYKLKFIDNTGLFEDITEQPVFRCPSCGQYHKVEEIYYVQNNWICVSCRDNLVTCLRCGCIHSSKKCPTCYTEEPCCVCGSSNETFLRDCIDERIPVCKKHANSELVIEASYNWKPESYTFRHMGKEK